MPLSLQADGALDAFGLSPKMLLASRAISTVDTAAGRAGVELLVADSTCPHIREFLATCHVPVLWLTGQQDPLSVVGRVLAQRRAQGTPVQILHWVSHGAPGAVFVGDQTINTKALLNAEQELVAWQLRTINLWSCSTGADHNFIRVLEELSGASVWASHGILGRQADGKSSWQLTNASTTDQPDLPISQSQQLSWCHQLGGFSVNTSNTRGHRYDVAAKENLNFNAFAVLKEDGSVVSWGDDDYGGNSSAVSSQLSSGVSQIFSNRQAFAALKEDGSVVTWGREDYGGDSSAVSSQLASGVREISSTRQAFAALKDDGSVITWGRSSTGGDSSSVSSSLSSGVSEVFSNDGAFAALKDDGSVITWGSSAGGDSSAVSSDLASGVTRITGNDYSFAALKDDGSVVTWGFSSSDNYGHDSSAVASDLASGVSQIFGAMGAFAALKDDGSVVTWGTSVWGGDSSSVSSSLSSGVRHVAATGKAFAALKDDGSVVTWGLNDEGGEQLIYRTGDTPIDVSSELTSGVSQIVANASAFAALKEDGTVVAWGDQNHGGLTSRSSSAGAPNFTEVREIIANGGGFAAIKNDGSVVAWGNANGGGYLSGSLTGVVQIFTSGGAFAALKDDGSVVTWGGADYGGNSSSVSSEISSGVVGFANPFTNDVYDSTAPTISIASNASSLKAGETATLSFTLSESSTNFEANDLTVSGGTLSNFSGSGTSYSATFTPTAASTTDGAISIASSKFSDAAGNTNADGSDANNSVSLTIDTVRPTIAVSSDVSSLKAGETATLSFTLSESSTNFEADDLTVSGGTLSNFSGSDSSYSATFTPAAYSTTDGAISVASSKFSDAAGNTNTDGSDANNSVSLTVYTVRPTFQSAVTNQGGTKIILTFSETLSSTTAAIGTFSATTAGKDNPITDVAIAGSTAELTLTNTIKSGQVVTVAYTDPSSSDDANAIQDSTGNDAASLSSTFVTNNSTVASDSSDSGSNPSDTNALVLNNNNSFSVTGGANQGLWLNLKVLSASTNLQNTLILIDQNNNVLGSIGATQYSKNCGSHAILIPEGSTISFQQASNNLPINRSPQHTITQQSDGNYKLHLNDDTRDSDHDDLILVISHSSSSPNPSATSMAAEQQQINDAILDLSSIPVDGQTLQITLNSDCSFINRFALVKLNQHSSGEFTVGGYDNTAGKAFDQNVYDNLINPGGSIITATGVQEKVIEWKVSSTDAGFYAPVMINPDRQIYTYGSSHIKALGCNFFAFEDDSTSSCDWDLNDLTAQFQII